MKANGPILLSGLVLTALAMSHCGSKPSQPTATLVQAVEPVEATPEAIEVSSASADLTLQILGQDTRKAMQSIIEARATHWYELANQATEATGITRRQYLLQALRNAKDGILAQAGGRQAFNGSATSLNTVEDQLRDLAAIAAALELDSTGQPPPQTQIRPHAAAGSAVNYLAAAQMEIAQQQREVEKLNGTIRNKEIAANGQ